MRSTSALNALVNSGMDGDDTTILEKDRESFENALKFTLLSSGINLVKGDMRTLKSGVWKRQWRCCHYENKGNRCKWSVSLVADHVPNGGVPIHRRVEGGRGCVRVCVLSPGPCAATVGVSSVSAT